MNPKLCHQTSLSQPTFIETESELNSLYLYLKEHLMAQKLKETELISTNIIVSTDIDGHGNWMKHPLSLPLFQPNY